ncbi:hypothetical protein MUNTM_21350 [Mycobacterium sp. MUNTM1]
MVELSGNATPGIIAGMLHEMGERHAAAISIASAALTVPKAEYTRLLKSYRRLAALLEARTGGAAEAHWRRHVEAAGAAMLRPMRRPGPRHHGLSLALGCLQRIER